MFILILILQIFDLEKRIVLKIDVFNYIIDMCISQFNVEERLKFIVFYFRKMVSTKLNYEIHNKELLIIIEAFRE